MNKAKIKTVLFNENNKLDINNIISYKFIPLETSDKSLIRSIKQIGIVDNKIYVNSEGDKLLVFDLSGKFISQIGNKEKQILTIADAVLDRIVHSSHRFDLKGEILRKKL